MAANRNLQLPSDYEWMGAEEALQFCVDTFPGRYALACSFQKEESALLDLMFKIDPNARVFALDTHYLFPETYEMWRLVEERYGIKVEKFEGPQVEEGLWETNPDLYLSIAKLEPLNRALLDLDCWVTGIRQTQSPTRANAKKIEWDAAHEIWKVNPICDWLDEDVWLHINGEKLPYNKLHDQGYDSIGDTHSTLPGKGREGRWAGTERTECGLHT